MPNEFIPEHGLAKSRMRQYLETTSSNTTGSHNHDVVVDELQTKGLAKSLLAKWKSMESVKAAENSSTIVLSNQVANILSSRSSANTTTTSRHSNEQKQQQQQRAISKERLHQALSPPVNSSSSQIDINAEINQLPQTGLAKQLLSKWEHNLETTFNHSSLSSSTVNRRSVLPPRPFILQVKVLYKIINATLYHKINEYRL